MNGNQSILIAITTIFSVLLLMLGTLAILAQEPAPEPTPTPLIATCSAALQAYYTAAGNACIGGPDGSICNGGAAPEVQPQGPVANSVAPRGSFVPVNVIDSVSTGPFAADGSNGGVVWFRAEAQGYRVLMVGDTTISDYPVEGFPKWQNMLVQTDGAASACVSAPNNAAIIQSRTPGEITQVGVNGVSIVLDGTVVIQTEADRTLFLVVEGIARLIANGQSVAIIAGQQSTTTYTAGEFTRPRGAPSDPMPYEIARLNNLPTSLLDRAILIPQPGIVRTQALVNLRSGPTTNAGIIIQVPAGTVMSVLGQNPTGEWYHVELPTGLTGWMFAELLIKSIGEISVSYQATPSVPQRLGEIGKTARVLVNSGAEIRTQPYTNYGAVAVAPLGTDVSLLARSPYGPWVKIGAGEFEGWVPLVALETRAVIEALPYDTGVVPPPLPPVPTPIPGSTGNAFPDPSCWPNC